MKKTNVQEISNDVHECGCSEPTREQIKQDLEDMVEELTVSLKQLCVDEGYEEYSEMALDYFIDFIRCQFGIDYEKAINAIQKNIKLFYPQSVSTDV